MLNERDSLSNGGMLADGRPYLMVPRTCDGYAVCVGDVLYSHSGSGREFRVDELRWDGEKWLAHDALRKQLMKPQDLCRNIDSWDNLMADYGIDDEGRARIAELRAKDARGE